MLRLIASEKEVDKMKGTSGNSMDEILEDTEQNTKLLLKVNGKEYPVCDCAIKTILSKAEVSGYGLRDLVLSVLTFFTNDIFLNICVII